MLILTRKPDQSIVIDGNVWVTVLGYERDRAKLHFRAPGDVQILRGELAGDDLLKKIEQAHLSDRELQIIQKTLKREGVGFPELDQVTSSARDGNEAPRKGGLILTRKIDQSVAIGEKVGLMVLGIDRDRVKLGINAPRDVAILRGELIGRDLAEQRHMPEGQRPSFRERPF